MSGERPIADSKTMNSSEIPKKIHYIWVGGPIPDKYMRHIIQMAEIAQKNGFELNVWTDNPSNFNKPLRQLPEDVHKNFKIQLRDIDEIQKKLFDYIDDVALRKKFIRVFNRIINEESVGFKNLAAVSDLLRLAILIQEGGLYLDTDLLLKVLNKDGLPTLSFDNVPHGFMGLAAEVTQEEDKPEEIHGFNNCLILANKNHEILLDALNIIIQNYQLLRYPFQDQRYTYFDIKRNPILSQSQPGYDKLSATIKASGPAPLLEAIENYALNHDIFESDLIIPTYSKNDETYVKLGDVDIHITCDNTWLFECDVKFDDKLPDEITSKNVFYLIKEEKKSWKVYFVNEKLQLRDVTDEYKALCPPNSKSLDALCREQYWGEMDKISDDIKLQYLRNQNKFSFDDASEKVSLKNTRKK